MLALVLRDMHDKSAVLIKAPFSRKQQQNKNTKGKRVFLQKANQLFCFKELLSFNLQNEVAAEQQERNLAVENQHKTVFEKHFEMFILSTDCKQK